MINRTGLSNITNLRRFADRLNWKNVSSGINLEFTEQIIDEFIDRWDWKSLSSNPNLPLSVEFVNKYKDKIDFKEFSRNPASLPFIYRYPYARKWNWDYVIINRGIHYDQDVFEFMFNNYSKWYTERYKNNPIFRKFALSSFINSIMCGLSGDHSFFLNDNYSNYFSWDRISKGCRTKLSLDFIEENKDKLNFKESNLLDCIKETITSDFIRQNHDLFDKSSFKFYYFPLSLDLLQLFWEEIDWFQLSSCEKLDWTWDFLLEHFDNFKINLLSTNKGIYERLFDKSFSNIEIYKLLDNQISC